MTVKVVSRITIDAPPEEVFKYLADTNFHFLWNPHLQDLSPMGKLKLGSKYKTTSWLLGLRVHGNNQVTKFKPGELFQIENNTGALKYRVNYSLQSSSKSTKLICATEVSAENQAFAFTAAILKLLARRELQSDLKALKIAAEHRLT